MSRVKYDGWVLKHKGYLFAATIEYTRKKLIESTLDDWGLTWKDAKKGGYSVVKVRVIEVKE